MTQVHCFYFSLSKIIEINQNEFINHLVLFHALGGHQMNIYQFENDNYPLMDIRGNVFDYEAFQRHTGISIRKKSQKDADHTFNILKSGRSQLVVANCFYLPYDEVNFQKVNDEHMLVIENYLPEKDMFIVSDVNHKSVMIKKNELEKARREVKYKPYEYFTLKKTNELIELKTVPQELKAIIKENAISFNKRISEIESKLITALKQMNECTPLFKKIAAKQLYRNFKHPNGLIATRLMMKESLENIDIYPKSVSELYGRLATLWEDFILESLKFGKGKIQFEELLLQFDELMKLEKEANSYLI